MKKIIALVLVFFIVQVSVIYYFLGRNDKKIVYADAIKLFNDYKFKADMERSSQAALNKMKNELDSAELIYKMNTNDLSAQRLLLEKQQKWSDGYSAINKEINQKVWERLNLLINKFGKEQGYELLIGANGMGTVLYASDSRDVTEDLIKYVNTNYEKGS
jgi:outer membrane protein